MSDDLRLAVQEVSRAVADVMAEVGPYVAGDSTYHARLKVAHTAAAERLRTSVGAKIRDEWNGCSIKIAGVRSTCTSGLGGGLHNWLVAAQKRLAS